MAKNLVCGAVLEGVISARIFGDGSLSIDVCYEGAGSQKTFHEEVELSPEGVKVLRDLLARSGEQNVQPTEAGDTDPQNGASDGGAYWICPQCGRDNNPPFQKCYMCGTPRPNHSVISDDASPASAG